MGLEIDSNPLRDDGIQAISEALETNEHIVTLFLANTRISTIGVKSIAAMLCVNTILTQLGIGYNDITDDGAELVANALKINATLNWLHMIDNDVSDNGALALAEGITAHNRKFDYFALTEPSSVSGRARTAIENALIANATAIH